MSENINDIQKEAIAKIEYAVIGGLISPTNELRKEFCDRFLPQIDPDIFTTYQNRCAFEALNDYYEKNKSVPDLNLLASLLLSHKATPFTFETATDYLNFLPNDCFDLDVFNQYLKRLIESWAINTLKYKVSHDLSSLSLNDDLSEVIRDIQIRVSEILSKNSTSVESYHFGSISEEFLENLAELKESDGSYSGIETGFTDLDYKTSGLQKSDLVIVAGRPSMGKTTFSCNIADNIAKAGGRGVIFSLEMSKLQLYQKALSSVARVNYSTIKNGRYSDHEFVAIKNAIKEIDGWQTQIVDEANITVDELVNKTLDIHRKTPLDFVLVDYLQLLQDTFHNKNKTENIAYNSRRLKGLAKTINAPVIALSQLSRSLEQRANKRPINSDLRESGSIEQDADLILFVYRDEIYNPDGNNKNKAEIIIGKQRTGSLGTIHLMFEGRYSQFSNISGDHESYDFSNDITQDGGL